MTVASRDPEENVIYVGFQIRGRFPDDPRAADKRRELRRLVESSMVMVVLDPRTPGVEVPDDYLGGSELRLNFSPRFGMDFRIGRQAIWATLTFGGVPHDCIVPWAAVKSMISHETKESVSFQ